MAKYVLLKDLKVYQLARELSKLAWKIYKELEWKVKKIMGDQFLESTDSIGANIAEGYNRHHFLDRIKFYYNARASLSEARNHWLELLYEREFARPEDYKIYNNIADRLSIKLNNFIQSTYKSKEKQSVSINLNESL